MLTDRQKVDQSTIPFSFSVYRPFYRALELQKRRFAQLNIQAALDQPLRPIFYVMLLSIQSVLGRLLKSSQLASW